jgi:hypothetical protein
MSPSFNSVEGGKRRNSGMGADEKGSTAHSDKFHLNRLRDYSWVMHGSRVLLAGEYSTRKMENWEGRRKSV